VCLYCNPTQRIRMGIVFNCRLFWVLVPALPVWQKCQQVEEHVLLWTWMLLRMLPLLHMQCEPTAAACHSVGMLLTSCC